MSGPPGGIPAPERGSPDRIGQAVAATWLSFTQAIFSAQGSPMSRAQRVLQAAWIAVLYLATLASWAVFVRFGRIEFGVQDWIWEWRYDRILKQALLTGTLPLHTQPPASYQVTRFLSLPDVPLAPQMALLRWLDAGTVFLVNLLLMVTVGYAACLVIRRRYRLSVFAFTALELLVTLNGFVTAHIGIGHTLFSGYFYLPFFALLVLQLAEGRPSRRWYALVAVVLFAIELQGTTQLFAVCLIFLGVLFLAARGLRAEIFKAILGGIILNLYRIAPAALGLAGYDNRPQPGYLSLTDLLQGLVQVVPPAKASKFITGLPVGWWELDVYVGLAGLAFLCVCGFYLSWRLRRAGAGSPPSSAITLSALALGLFSIGYLYWPINYLPVPLISLVHVPSRFMILPLLGLAIMAAINLQSWLNSTTLRPTQHLGLLAGLLILGHDLFQHARLWRVEHVFEAFPAAGLDTSLHIVNPPDPVYATVLLVSTLISLAALGFAVFIIVRREPRSGA